MLFAVLMMTQVAVKSIKAQNGDESDIQKARNVSFRITANILTLILRHIRPS